MGMCKSPFAESFAPLWRVSCIVALIPNPVVVLYVTAAAPCGKSTSVTGSGVAVPGSPLSPLSPLSPFAPCGPAGPTGPAGPAGPASPLGMKNFNFAAFAFPTLYTSAFVPGSVVTVLWISIVAASPSAPSLPLSKCPTK